MQKELLLWNLRLCCSIWIVFLQTQDAHVHPEGLLLLPEESSTTGYNSGRDLPREDTGEGPREEDAQSWYWNREGAAGRSLLYCREVCGKERGLLGIHCRQHLVVLSSSCFCLIPDSCFMWNLWMVLRVGIGSGSPFPGEYCHWQDSSLKFIDCAFRAWGGSFCLWRSDSGKRTVTLCSWQFYNLPLFFPPGLLQETGVRKKLLQLLLVRRNDPNCSILCTHTTVWGY